jgi:hypothetical protein
MPRTLFEQFGIVADELFQPRPQPLALLPHFGEECGIGHGVHHRRARRHGQRVAAIG